MPMKSLSRLYARAQVCSMKVEQIEQARAGATVSHSFHTLHGIPTPFTGFLLSPSTLPGTQQWPQQHVACTTSKLSESAQALLGG